MTAKVVDGDARLTEDELLRRRQQVLWLKQTRRLTSADVGRRLNVSLRTIERDLAWWRTEFRACYSSSAPTFDALGVIGDTVEFYAQIESEALAEYARLEHDPMEAVVQQLTKQAARPDLPADVVKETLAVIRDAMAQRGDHQRKATHQRMRCLKTAIETRRERVDFLGTLGLLDRTLGLADEEPSLRGDAISRAVEAARLINADPKALLPPALGGKPHTRH